MMLIQIFFMPLLIGIWGDQFYSCPAFHTSFWLSILPSIIWFPRDNLLVSLKQIISNLYKRSGPCGISDLTGFFSFWSYAPWYTKKYLFTLARSGSYAYVCYGDVLPFYAFRILNVHFILKTTSQLVLYISHRNYIL